MRVKLGDYIKEYSVKNKNNEDIPVYSVSNSLGFCKDYFGKEVASKNKTTYKIVPRGCFAYNPSRINVGSVDWQNEEERVIVSPLYNIFSVSPLLDQQYLLYYLKSNVTLSRIRAVASGSVRDNLKLSMLYEFPIDLISLEQQYDVVSTLNAVQKIIDLYQKELSGLDELIRARFVEMFGTIRENSHNYPRVTLKEVCHKITDGKHGGCKQEDNSGYYYVGAREIYDGKIHYDTAPQITYDDFSKDYRRCNLEKGDMVIVNTGATIGKSAIASSHLTEKTLLQKSVALIKVNSDIIIAEFLRYCYMVNPSMYMVKSASAQPNLLLSKMNSTIVYLPPIDLQRQFASFVEEIDKSRSRIQKSLEASQELFDSLMQEYFG